MLIYTIKYASKADLDACATVEKLTMEDFCYLRDVWDYFLSTQGEMICVYDQNRMVAIGKFTVLYDGSGWLETLRVIPEYQSRKIGSLIYEEYVKLARLYQCDSIAMYTGSITNISSALAMKYGLSYQATFQGFYLENYEKIDTSSFTLAESKDVISILLNEKKQYQDYVCSNRTFYRINYPNMEGFLCEHKVYKDEMSGSVIVLGSRFQHQKALHILMMIGDLDKCIEFAKYHASNLNISKIICTISIENHKVISALIENRFELEKSTLVTLEKKFK